VSDSDQPEAVITVGSATDRLWPHCAARRGPRAPGAGSAHGSCNSFQNDRVTDSRAASSIAAPQEDFRLANWGNRMPGGHLGSQQDRRLPARGIKAETDSTAKALLTLRFAPEIMRIILGHYILKICDMTEKAIRKVILTRLLTRD
jgi:hypothetical protein